MIRTENNRYACILYLFQFCCQGLNGQHHIFVFLCTLYNCLGSIEIGFSRLISAFLPVDCIAQFVICEILRNIDVPANRRNAVPFRTPFNDSFSCLVIPAIERIIVHIVETTDCRIVAEILLDVFKFGFIALQICTAVAVRAAFCMTAAIDFLLTGEHMLSVNITEIIHQALCFGSCLRVAQRRGNIQCWQIRLLYRNRIISSIAIFRQKLNLICAFFQAVNAKAEICPAISIRHLHHKFRTIDGDGLFPSVFVQNLCRTGGEFIHSIFWCFHLKGQCFTGQVAETAAGIPRKLLPINIRPSGCTVQIFAFCLKNDVLIGCIC